MLKVFCDKNTTKFYSQLSFIVLRIALMQTLKATATETQHTQKSLNLKRMFNIFPKVLISGYELIRVWLTSFLFLQLYLTIWELKYPIYQLLQFLLHCIVLYRFDDC